MGFEELLGVNPWTALMTLANTIALFLVGRKYLFGPIMKMIEDRQKEIDGMYDAAGAAREEADAMKQEYQQKLSAAQATSDRMVKEAVARAQSREEEIIRQASAILDKAAADIAQEKKKAINDAKDEISDMAMAIAGKVVGRTLNSADQAALVEHFINELGEQA